MRQPLPDSELWSAANMVLRQWKEEAELRVAERIGQCAAEGDDAGVQVWRAIAWRIDKMRRPDGSA